MRLYIHVENTAPWVEGSRPNKRWRSLAEGQGHPNLAGFAEQLVGSRRIDLLAPLGVNQNDEGMGLASGGALVCGHDHHRTGQCVEFVTACSL